MRALLFVSLFCPVMGFSQVGIGTSNVNASAKLQVDATSQGFLPPRVALTSTATTSNAIANPATGLMVYNTATAGTSPNNVTPGFYYYDGSKWQRVINQQLDATVSFSTADPNTGSPTFDPPANAASKDYIYVSSVDNSQWTYNGTTYVTYTPPATTAWFATGGIVDAGSNKTSSIVRSGKVGIGGNTSPNATLDIRTNPTNASDPGAGFIGIGTTNATAVNAAAGAIRYNTTSGGVLEYSNGSAWNTLSSNVQKANVYATRLASSVFNVAHSTTTSYSFGSFTSSTGAGTGQFNTTTGVYTAPRTGLYSISAGISFVLRNASTNGVFFFLVMKNGINGTESCNMAVPASFPTNQIMSANISCAVPLNAGETVQLKYLNWTNATAEISLDPNYQGRYYFSVTEN